MIEQLAQPSPDLLIKRMQAIAAQRERALDELAVVSVEYRLAMDELVQARASIQALQAELAKFNPPASDAGGEAGA